MQGEHVSINRLWPVVFSLNGQGSGKTLEGNNRTFDFVYFRRMEVLQCYHSMHVGEQNIFQVAHTIHTRLDKVHFQDICHMCMVHNWLASAATLPRFCNTIYNKFSPREWTFDNTSMWCPQREDLPAIANNLISKAKKKGELSNFQFQNWLTF